MTPTVTSSQFWCDGYDEHDLECRHEDQHAPHAGHWLHLAEPMAHDGCTVKVRQEQDRDEPDLPMMVRLSLVNHDLLTEHRDRVACDVVLSMAEVEQLVSALHRVSFDWDAATRATS